MGELCPGPSFSRTGHQCPISVSEAQEDGWGWGIAEPEGKGAVLGSLGNVFLWLLQGSEWNASNLEELQGSG